MRVKQIGILPSAESTRRNCTALPPEMLAASLARYSRNDEGFDQITSKVQFGNREKTLRHILALHQELQEGNRTPEDFLDMLEREIACIQEPDFEKSVDSVFKMVDYGHQSIADMVPVCIVIEGLSIFLAYHLWTLIQQGSGQETSTRYCKFKIDSLYNPFTADGTPSEDSWKSEMRSAFSAYDEAVEIWEDEIGRNPKILGLTDTQLEARDEKGVKARNRMIKNGPFDRARYFIPVAATTNMGVICSAREWAKIIRSLGSNVHFEGRSLATELLEALKTASPRMARHASVSDMCREAHSKEFLTLTRMAGAFPSSPADDSSKESVVDLEILDLDWGYPWKGDLDQHENRYDPIGPGLSMTAVGFTVERVAMAELRDMNRHRTGTKACLLYPLDFYYAQDQMPLDSPNFERLKELAKTGVKSLVKAVGLLKEEDPNYVYHTLLGHQYDFSQTTTLDKLIYMLELRTGKGAHFRYARHYRDVADLLFEKYPELKGKICLGKGEPE